jgi:hypothetical protein
MQHSSPTSGLDAHCGQRIRLRRSSRLAREWNIPPESEGMLICRYRILARSVLASERFDVRFGSRLTLWGVPAAEFETIKAAEERATPA